MTKLSPLLEELLEKRPLTAMKVLTGMKPSDAASFFAVLPTDRAVSLMSQISAWSASSIIIEMDSVTSAAVLKEMDYQIAAAIVRILPEPHQSNVLDELPRKLRSDISATLTYPVNTVGAQMSLNIIVVSNNDTVGDAMLQLRQIKRSRTGVAFVVNTARRFVGVIGADQLIQSPSDLPLSEIVDPTIKPLSARATLSTIKSLPAWDDYAYLPVVDRERVLIGALARRVFTKATIDLGVGEEATQHSLLGSIADAFFGGSADLARVLSDLDIPNQPAVSKVSRATKEERSL